MGRRQDRSSREARRARAELDAKVHDAEIGYVIATSTTHVVHLGAITYGVEMCYHVSRFKNKNSFLKGSNMKFVRKKSKYKKYSLR